MTYKLKNLDAILNHWPVIAWVIHDKTDQPLNKTELEAQVASQDYFALLATRLDQIAETLAASEHTGYLNLEQSVKELLYLHHAFTIRKK